MSDKEALENIISDKIRRKEDLEERITKAENLAANFKGYDYEAKLAVYQQALNAIKPRIISLLLRNYENSGIESRTGTLRANISRARIAIYFPNKNEGTGPELSIRMPRESEAKKYAGKDGTKKAYIVANVLDAGAIRTSEKDVLSGYAKNKIKKKLGRDGTDITAGVMVNLKGKKGKHSTKYKASYLSDGRVKGSTLIVMDARPYFHLTPSQMETISNDLSTELKRLLS